MGNIAILASGGGSNALKIIEYFKESQVGDVNIIITNNLNAGVIQHALNHGIDYKIFPNDVWISSPQVIIDFLKSKNIDLIVLAGFLRKIPRELVLHYPKLIVNIHPALLPKYGGKGMYGMNVHRAVFNAKEKKSGITIHWVNDQYDEGGIIFQAEVDLKSVDSPEEIHRKVLQLEHVNYPKVIESILKNKAEP